MLGVAGIVLYLVAPDGLPRIAVYAAVTILCLLAFALSRRDWVEADRTAWALLAVGLVGWAIGDLITGVFLIADASAPLVSSADVAYLVGECGFVGAILAVKDGGERVFRLEHILEGLIMAVGLGLVSWVFVVGFHADGALGVDEFDRFFTVVVYAGADGFLLSLMVLLLLSRRARTVPFVMTTLAFGSFVATGWVTHIAATAPDLRSIEVYSVGWLIGYVLLSAAAQYPTQRLWAEVEHDPGPRRGIDRTRLVVLSGAMLISPVVMGVQLARGVPVGQWGWVVLATSVTAVALAGARMAYFLSVLRRQADALSEAAVSDPVTGLANRRHIGALLDRSIEESGERGVVVFVVDIDRFASINETFGYSVGDRVLREIGQRLVSVSARGSLVGRLGGDQFVVFCDRRSLDRAAAVGAEDLRLAISGTMFVHDINVALDATVGAVESSAFEHVDAEAMLQHAHVALTSAKHSHRRTSVYASSMDRDRHEQMRLLGELDTAVQEGQLRVYFQPCLNLASGTVCGAEALLRWQHPREGLIGPCSFLPDAERTGLLPAITAYVLHDALAFCARMRTARPNFTVSINLSVRNLLDPGIVAQVREALAEHGVPATAVELEVTETTAMTDPRRSVDALLALRRMGVSIAIDDYGTGYSSLAYLRTLPVQTLKIDRSFVTAMTSEPTNISIVGSTIDLARSLGMTTVAEGVEDVETLERLCAMGCDGAQGFELGHAVPADELSALVGRIEARMHTRILDGGVRRTRETLGSAVH